MTTFVCNSIGHVTGDVKLEQQSDGTWVASCPVGNVFGHESEGQHTGQGATKEDALSALNKGIEQFNEMIWL